MKKILSVLLVFALVFSLAACGNNTKKEDPKKDNSSTQSDEKTSSKPTTSSEPATSSKPSVSSTPTTSSTPSSTPKPVVPQIEEPTLPVSSTNIYSTRIVQYSLNDQCRGYYFTPKAEGKYPTFILIHGKGGVHHSFKIKVQSCMDKWVREGYLPPMVVVIPEVYDYNKNGYDIDDFQLFVHRDHTNRFTTLLKSIEQGTLTDKIDTSKKPYVAGFSMGGMSALHIGVEYRESVNHVGALSPSSSFYLGEGKWGFYNHATDIHFAEDAHAYLACGQGEGDGVKKSIADFETAIAVNNPGITTKYLAPASWGGHDWPLAQKQIFMYLYFAAFDKLPSTALVQKVCDPNAYIIPQIVSQPENEHK